jgi:hypothetical protein
MNAAVPIWFLAATYVNDALKALLSAYILQRVIRGPVHLNTLKQFGTYIATAVLGMPILSALAGPRRAFRSATSSGVLSIDGS